MAGNACRAPGCPRYTRVMAKQQKGSDQTEKPTPKRLQDARKDGDVAKSKELTSTVILLAWLVMAWLAVPFAVHKVTELFERTFDAVGRVGSESMTGLWIQAFKTLLVVSIPLLLFAIAIGLLTEFLQVGGLFVPKRMSPQVDRMNPVEGMKRMFSQDNLVDVVSSFLKTAGLVLIAY